MTNTDKIIEWKSKNYCGKNIYLKPVALEDLQFIVDMRNQEKSKYYLDQKEDSTLDSQRKWYDAYEIKDDDIYWVYCDVKTDRKLGTIRIYNIEESTCEIGSSTADLTVDNAFISFIEAHSLAMQFAREILQMPKMHVATRTDNKFVDMVLRRLGFKFKKTIDKRGVEHNYYEIEM